MHTGAICSQWQQCASAARPLVLVTQVSLNLEVTEQKVLSMEAILKAPFAFQSQALGSIK